jgi:acylphosphatase
VSSPGKVARRIVVAGEVQGVGFRYALAREARRRSLCGWVRNLRDGTVEALVLGEGSDVDAIIDWARSGPPAARVSAVDVHDVPDGMQNYDSFEIVATA